MSQASNKVKLCLNKAERELEEKGIHRGLVKTEPNKHLAEKHITKAQHNLNAAFYFERGGYSDWSASAFFYCIYHCFLAILRRFGYESRNQECTIATIEMLKEEGAIQLDDAFIIALKSVAGEDIHEASVIQLREIFSMVLMLNLERRRGLVNWWICARKLLMRQKRFCMRSYKITASASPASLGKVSPPAHFPVLKFAAQFCQSRFQSLHAAAFRA